MLAWQEESSSTPEQAGNGTWRQICLKASQMSAFKVKNTVMGQPFLECDYGCPGTESLGDFLKMQILGFLTH